MIGALVLLTLGVIVAELVLIGIILVAMLTASHLPSGIYATGGAGGLLITGLYAVIDFLGSGR